MIAEDQILQILLDEADIETACRRLIDAANENGGQDNVTVVLIRVE
jgi:protein phosphatase